MNHFQVLFMYHRVRAISTVQLICSKVISSLFLYLQLRAHIGPFWNFGLLSEDRSACICFPFKSPPKYRHLDFFKGMEGKFGIQLQTFLKIFPINP